ncbi:hypothetical protein NW752_000548 [Fusarium irregulare]|uniref:GMP synthase n=1 Tax=Fusarium irregulare TaxID=2494466 RepID=A0A9W8UEG7_9HYPO|nr:hypothetical protein NW766_001282 [Fusarium irregulare]KAJ4028291.1 hypothetical protein NW752_000548 [Fusarium irregulare]
MSKYKDIMKNGWHPEKSGTTFKGQVKGLVGRGDKADDRDRSNHVSVPVSQLKDPASFAPPPKRTGSGLIPAAPRTDSSATRKVGAAPSRYQDPYGESHEQIEEPPQPRGPYRTDTTGLSTDNLPKPPGRRDGADGRSPQPPSYQSAMTGVGGGRAAPPSLPPRLPPRTNSASTVGSSPAASPAPTGNGLLNQGAVNRLGAAGINVPGFGIGRSSPAAAASPSPPPPPRPGVASAPPTETPSHMSELQNRFSKLGTSSSNANANANTAATPPPSEGTTWAQKQAAFKTASSFQKDPSSVSFSDARAAASTANNFRQRHGEQVAAGAKAANNLNQKYGLLDKAQNSYAKVQGAQGQGQSQNQDQGAGVPSTGLASVAGKKKPPPPPPKKKPALMSAQAPPADDEPPPIPMATRPQF